MKAGTGADIQHAIRVLKAGGLVAIPTETVYGLAANAFDPEAVIKIFEAKKRPFFNPLIVHAASLEQISTFAGPISPVLRQLADTFWPGPLTILLPRKEAIHPLVTADSPMVAVRIPAHPLTLQLLQQLPFPLAAPSANLFGTISPTTAEHVQQQFGEALGYILDGGQAAVGVESTIIKEENGKINILRPGGITQEQLAAVLGYVPERTVKVQDQPEAPGMLKSHYAPKIPLVMGDISDLLEKHHDKRIAVLGFSRKYAHDAIIVQYQLSASGDVHEAAKNVFSALHTLEDSGAEIILGEWVPSEGIGVAINDRLERASA